MSAASAETARAHGAPPVVIGVGRIGRVLLRLPDARSVGRDGPWEGWPAEGPVLVATRNDDLDEVIPRVPLAARARLVFVQNGVLDAVLARHGLAPDQVTLGILYFAAAARDGVAIAGGTSWFTGPWAEGTAALLRGLGLPAEAIGAQDFRREQGVKLAWTVVFGLLGEVAFRRGEDHRVGAVLRGYRPEIAALCAELRPVLSWGLGGDPGALEGPICRYSSCIEEFPLRLKELPWRNGLVRAWARASATPTPEHERLLSEVGF